MPNLAMRLPGTQFSADGLDLAWPLGGEREVRAVPDDDQHMTLRIKRRIAEGHIVIVDDAPTFEIDHQAREYRLLTGDEARRHMMEPAGPVTRVVYHPATPEEEQTYQLEVQEVQTESDRFKESQAAAAEAAAAAHIEIGQRQAEAETASATPAAVAEEAEAVVESVAEPVVETPIEVPASSPEPAPKPKPAARRPATKAKPKAAAAKSTTKPPTRSKASPSK